MSFTTTTTTTPTTTTTTTITTTTTFLLASNEGSHLSYKSMVPNYTLANLRSSYLTRTVTYITVNLKVG
jgi:hypothetical protein